jgi:predicted GNAT superfamily acetyltransferase
VNERSCLDWCRMACMMLKPIESSDLPDLLALNNANAPHVGLLELAALEALWREAAVQVVLRDEHGLAGFLIALDQHASYRSPNYRWFCERYNGFLYVDRIAVAARCRGTGLGRRLYEAAFDGARERGLTSVTCEVNSLPPNPGSLAFHTRLGFRRVGELVHEPDRKAVVMLLADVAPIQNRTERRDGESRTWHGCS